MVKKIMCIFLKGKIDSIETENTYRQSTTMQQTKLNELVSKKK